MDRRSIHAEALREAGLYKWIESQKAGQDLGITPVRSWVQKHWFGFLRDKWFEHLEGTIFWIEFDRGDFGLLKRELREEPLARELVDRLKAGFQNLSILLWAQQEGHPLDKVAEILERIDIASMHVE